MLPPLNNFTENFQTYKLNMSNEIAKHTTQEVELPTSKFSAFSGMADFELAQRMAKALCSSSIVPENYQGERNLGNCIIALEMSNRIGANVLAVCQNLYIVHGKPAWSSQFLISCVNASRQFTPLRYKMTGDKGQDDYGCIAWADDRKGERLESPEVTIAMAKAEGWYQKNGSKWKTMPELMLRYRAATLFARLYAPELTMGIRTDDEVIDIDAMADAGWENAAGKKFQIEKQEPAPSIVTLAHAPIKAIAATIVDDNPELAPEPPKAAPVRSAVKTEPKAVRSAPAPVAPATAPQSPALAAMLADDATASSPESEPEPAAEPWTVQNELKSFCMTGSFGLKIFTEWALQAKWLSPDEIDKISEWSQIPQTIAVRCLRSKSKLTQDMTKIANGGRL